MSIDGRWLPLGLLGVMALAGRARGSPLRAVVPSSTARYIAFEFWGDYPHVVVWSLPKPIEEHMLAQPQQAIGRMQTVEILDIGTAEGDRPFGTFFALPRSLPSWEGLQGGGSAFEISRSKLEQLFFELGSKRNTLGPLPRDMRLNILRDDGGLRFDLTGKDAIGDGIASGTFILRPKRGSGLKAVSSPKAEAALSWEPGSGRSGSWTIDASTDFDPGFGKRLRAVLLRQTAYDSDTMFYRISTEDGNILFSSKLYPRKSVKEAAERHIKAVVRAARGAVDKSKFESLTFLVGYIDGLRPGSGSKLKAVLSPSAMPWWTGPDFSDFAFPPDAIDVVVKAVAHNRTLVVVGNVGANARNLGRCIPALLGPSVADYHGVFGYGSVGDYERSGSPVFVIEDLVIGALGAKGALRSALISFRKFGPVKAPFIVIRMDKGQPTSELFEWLEGYYFPYEIADLSLPASRPSPTSEIYRRVLEERAKGSRLKAVHVRRPYGADLVAINRTSMPVFFSRTGLMVPSSGRLTISDYAFPDEIWNDEFIFSAIDEDKILLNDGLRTLTKEESFEFLAEFGKRPRRGSGLKAVQSVPAPKFASGDLIKSLSEFQALPYGSVFEISDYDSGETRRYWLGQKGWAYVTSNRPEDERAKDAMLSPERLAELFGKPRIKFFFVAPKLMSL